MKKTMRTWAIEYRESKRHRKAHTEYVAAKDEQWAEELFLRDHPDAVITYMGEREEWTREDLSEVERILYEAERMKGCYFWSGEGNRSSRDYYEKKHSVDKVIWWEGGHEYSAEYQVICHYSYTKAYGYYYKDGEKTTLTTIRNSFRRIEAKREQEKKDLLEAANQ